MMKPSFTLPLVSLLLAACATTETPEKAEKPAAKPPAAVAAATPPATPASAVTPPAMPTALQQMMASAAAAGGTPNVKPYERVITSDAKTQPGLFTIHTVKDKVFFEIPKALLDQPLLMAATATAVPVMVEHIGRELNQDVIKFSLRDNKLYLLTVSEAYVSEPGRPITAAVQGSQRDAIVLVMPVEAYAKNGAPVVDFSRFFLSEIGNFSARMALRATGLDSNRSYLAGTKAFPNSLRIDAVHTYGFAPGAPTPGMPVISQPPIRTGTVDVAYNIVRLPETPMRPRLADDRVGFFALQRFDFGSAEHGSKRELLITRWRLEKKDPAAALSEPVKPLVWYIDRSTPTWLVPYVKKGVEAWNVAFEAAGFKNAVQARPYPTAEEDPEFDPEDLRYSVIRWVPSMIPNAYSPHLADPRSGEILNSNVVMFHNLMELLRDWYVSQVGAVDPRAKKLPLPDELMGELVSHVVTHELGHSLGFPHNMKASSLYPTAKLRDAKWLAEMGHTPSLMDYSRFNYLVQPEDKIDPALLIPKVGPYDIFATRWGYMPIPEAKTAEEEKPTLQAWLREQDEKPWLRFTAPRRDGDWGDQMEAVGDADAVLATSWGIKNLKRIVQQLPDAALRRGEDDRLLEQLYGATWFQWVQELGHVLAVVGGYDTHNKHGGQAGAIFTALPRERQAKAVKLLNEQLFATPTWLFEPAVIERLRPSEPGNRVLAVQRAMVRALLDRGRTARMQQQEAALGSGKAYGVDALLADLRQGIYPAGEARPTAHRRSLQRVYLETLIARHASAAPSLVDDSRPSLRAELRSLQELFSARAAASGDRVLKAHWEDLRDSTARALDPRAQPPVALSPLAALFAPARGFAGTTDEHAAEERCWPFHAHGQGPRWFEEAMKAP